MMKTLYVGNVPFSATEEQIREFFEQSGTVTSVRVILDRETGRSRGFCFVEMEDQDADNAIQTLNGASMLGRSLRVNEAKPREVRAPRDTSYYRTR